MNTFYLFSMMQDAVSYQGKRDSYSDRTIHEVTAAAGITKVAWEGKQSSAREPRWGLSIRF